MASTMRRFHSVDRTSHNIPSPTVAVCSDNETALTDALVRSLRRRGFTARRFGALSDDKPDHLNSQDSYETAAAALVSGRVAEAVVCSWTGAGAAISAMRVPGARAAYCTDAETARRVRQWLGANVLALSLRLTSEVVMEEILDAWLSTTATDTGVDAAQHGVEMGPAVLSQLVREDNSSIARVLDAVERYDRIRGAMLTDTLLVYCSNRFSLTRAAAALRVHPNTVAYRLHRIRGLTALDYRTPEDLLVLGLAARMLGGPGWTTGVRHTAPDEQVTNGARSHSGCSE
jgi:ribose 5-phosphate isomerase B